jgi:hypothetical protein
LYNIHVLSMTQPWEQCFYIQGIVKLKTFVKGWLLILNMRLVWFGSIKKILKNTHNHYIHVPIYTKLGTALGVGPLPWASWKLYEFDKIYILILDSGLQAVHHYLFWFCFCFVLFLFIAFLLVYFLKQIHSSKKGDIKKRSLFVKSLWKQEDGPSHEIDMYVCLVRSYQLYQDEVINNLIADHSGPALMPKLLTITH